jgi:hypothetical protein
VSEPGPREQQAAGDPEGGRRPPLHPRRLVPWAAALAPWSVALLLAVAARALPGAVEAHFARGVYPRVAGFIGEAARGWAALTGAPGRAGSFPSLSEVGILVLAVAACWLLRRGWRSGGAGGVLRQGLAGSGGLALVFLLLWGLNYSRLPLAASLGLEPSGASASELDGLAGALEAQLVPYLTDPGSPGGRAPGVPLPTAAAAAWREALSREPVLGSGAGVLVRPVLSGAIVGAGISGIFSPFTQEAHVAAHLPEPDLLFTACHELAHAQGWAREDEANYLAWRVGSRASSAELRAAARLLALGHVLGALGRADRARLAARVDGLDPRIRAAMEERARFWDRERSPAASRAASAVNDAYLRAQGQEGVASYGRMVDLLVAEWRAAGEQLPGGDPR